MLKLVLNELSNLRPASAMPAQPAGQPVEMEFGYMPEPGADDSLPRFSLAERNREEQVE